jgi:hypothetical protein
MSAIDEGHCHCVHFDEGDWVESRLNPNVFGIVVGESEFGRYYHVQIASSMEIRVYHGVTLRHMDVQQDEPPTAKKAPVVEDDNVIDFTKERKLRKTTTTRGAA